MHINKKEKLIITSDNRLVRVEKERYIIKDGKLISQKKLYKENRVKVTK